MKSVAQIVRLFASHRQNLKEKRRRGMLRPRLRSNGLVAALVQFAAGRKTCGADINLLFGNSAATLTRAKWPFVPPAPLNVSRYWFRRCVSSLSRYGLIVTGAVVAK